MESKGDKILHQEAADENQYKALQCPSAMSRPMTTMKRLSQLGQLRRRFRYRDRRGR
jgi:hypothetical protein